MIKKCKMFNNLQAYYMIYAKNKNIRHHNGNKWAGISNVTITRIKEIGEIPSIKTCKIIEKLSI